MKTKKIARKKEAKKFPNGFASWQETHFEVVSAISEAVNGEGGRSSDPEFENVATKRRDEQGTGGLYELAEELTDKFERKHKGREWDGEFFDEITDFLKEELTIQKIVFNVTYLDKEGNVIDTTQIDERSEQVARDLYKEFGHETELAKIEFEAVRETE